MPRPKIPAPLRRLLLTLAALAGLAASAAAQISSAPNTIPGTEANPFPILGLPTNLDAPPERYRKLPYRDLVTSIHIELAAAALYDFDHNEVRRSGADYMQQTANLIFEHAKDGPVRIECRSDRGGPAAAQKSAALCATTVAKWLTVEEKLGKVKFTTLGTAAPPATQPGTTTSSITIDFAKK